MSVAESPVKTFRQEQGLSRRDLAILADVPYHRVYEAERGTAFNLHPAIVSVMSLLKYPGDLAVDYRRWREMAAQAVQTEIDRRTSGHE